MPSSHGPASAAAPLRTKATIAQPNRSSFRICPSPIIPLQPRQVLAVRRRGRHVESGVGALREIRYQWPSTGGKALLRGSWGLGMTYCCGILVRDGLVMIADTRTNAGLDNVSTFRKLHIFAKPGERIMAVASAGNLAISQSVISTLTEGVQNPDTGEVETLMNAPTMFQAAQRIGRAIRLIHATEGPALRSADVSFHVSFLFGGQIKGSRMRLFLVYTAGNFIQCTTDLPHLQIGEHKYGDPVLDRAMHYDVELYE